MAAAGNAVIALFSGVQNAVATRTHIPAENRRNNQSPADHHDKHRRQSESNDEGGHTERNWFHGRAFGHCTTLSDCSKKGVLAKIGIYWMNTHGLTLVTFPKIQERIFSPADVSPETSTKVKAPERSEGWRKIISAQSLLIPLSVSTEAQPQQR
jgi:hypothetical protein